MKDQGIIFLGYIKLIYFRGNSILNHSSILSIIKSLCIYIILSIIFIFNESAYSAVMQSQDKHVMMIENVAVGLACMIIKVIKFVVCFYVNMVHLVIMTVIVLQEYLI